MAVKIADTIKPMADFPAAESIDLDITLLSGVHKSIQKAYEDGDLGGTGNDFQFTEMPVPSSEYLEKVIQFVGDTGTYKKGKFYECSGDLLRCYTREVSGASQYAYADSNDSTYSKTDFEQAASKEELSEGTGTLTFVSVDDEKLVLNDGSDDIEFTRLSSGDLGELSWIGLDTEEKKEEDNVIYADTIPYEFEFKNSDTIVYTGTDRGYYKKGSIYKVHEFNGSPLYGITLTNSSGIESLFLSLNETIAVGSELFSTDSVFEGVVKEYNDETGALTIYNLNTSGGTEKNFASWTRNTSIDSPSSSGKYLELINDSTPAEVPEVELNYVPQLETVPTANAENNGVIFQYIGISDAIYKNGYFYECAKIDGTSEYSWKNKMVQPNEDVPHWYGTQAEYEANKEDIVDGTYVHITDDYIEGAGIVDVVEENNMRAPTSNAVYDALMKVTTLTPTKTDKVGVIYEAEFLRIGRLVSVNLNLIVTSGGILYTDLPRPTMRQTFTINGYTATDLALRLVLRTDGSIMTDNTSSLTNVNVGGHLVYIAAE